MSTPVKVKRTLPIQRSVPFYTSKFCIVFCNAPTPYSKGYQQIHDCLYRDLPFNCSSHPFSPFVNETTHIAICKCNTITLLW